jgi:hypothetical protein
MPLLKADQDDSTTPVTVLRYREALKLLSDPLLPVRGHGLIMLQDVVRADDFDRALVPGILDIFMRSIEDEDSFMYLNAVKGLSAMVHGLGREVLRTLVGAYSSGLSSSGTLSATELDRRLRFGEALMQSVRRCGSAIGAYGERNSLSSQCLHGCSEERWLPSRRCCTAAHQSVPSGIPPDCSKDIVSFHSRRVC